MRRLCLLVLLLGLPACNGEEGFAPTGPDGPSIPSIGGSYTSPNLYLFELSDNAGPRTFECGGAITIGTQIATSFTGTFLLRDDRCSTGSITGTVTAGTFAADGTISFELTVPGIDPNFLTAAFGCTYLSGDRALTGTLVGTDLQAEAQTVMDCGTNGITSLHVRIAGSR
jgi:hypothetical protein